MSALSSTSGHSHLGLRLGGILSIRRFGLMLFVRPISLFLLLRPVHLFFLLRPIHLLLLPPIPLRPPRRSVRPGLRRTRGPGAHKPGLGKLLGRLEGVDTLLGRFEPGGHKGLLEVEDDVFDVFEAETDADEVRGDAAFDLLFVGELLVRGDPRVDDEGFGITDVGEMAAEFEVVDDGADFVDVSGLGQRF